MRIFRAISSLSRIQFKDSSAKFGGVSRGPGSSRRSVVGNCGTVHGWRPKDTTGTTLCFRRLTRQRNCSSPAPFEEKSAAPARPGGKYAELPGGESCEKKRGDRLTIRISYMPLSSNAGHCQREPFCSTRPPRDASESPSSKATGLTRSAQRFFHCVENSDSRFGSVGRARLFGDVRHRRPLHERLLE